MTLVTATEKPPAGPEAAPRPGPAGPVDLVECGECGASVPVAVAENGEHTCPVPTITGPVLGTRALYIRHPFDDTRPTGYPPNGLCTVLDDDGQLCGRPYGEHLT